MFGKAKLRTVDSIPSLITLGLGMGVGLDNNVIVERRKAIFLHNTVANGSFVSKSEQLGAMIGRNEARHSLRVAAEMYGAVTDGFPPHRILDAVDMATLKPLIPASFHDVHSSQQHFWVLIQAVSNLKTFEDLITKPGEGTHPLILNRFRNTPDMMKVLGQIVVMDLFYGNTDRLALTDSRGEGTFDTWQMFNEGNIFFQAPLTGGGTRIVGLDFYDGSCFFRTLNKSLEDVHDTAGGYYSGIILKKGDAALRDWSARAIVHLLNQKLLPTGVQLGPKHVTKLRDGMTEARARLKVWLSNKRKQGALLPGLQSRVALLNW